MSTLKQWREDQAAKPVYDAEAAHHEKVVEARTSGLRNLTAAEYSQAAKLADPEGQELDGERKVTGWPDDAHAMFNGSSEPCDMWSGPCSCGAWHREGI